MQSIPPQSTEENDILLFPSGCRFRKERVYCSAATAAGTQMHPRKTTAVLHLIRLSPLLLKLNSDLLSMSEWETLLRPVVVAACNCAHNDAPKHYFNSGITCPYERHVSGGWSDGIRAKGGINLLPQQTFIAQHHGRPNSIFYCTAAAKDQQ